MARSRGVVVATVVGLLITMAAGGGGLAAEPANSGGAPGLADTAAPSEYSPVKQGQRGNCSFPFSAVDATGTNVTVEEEPHIVVGLGANVGQILWEIGDRDDVQGLTGDAMYLNGTEDVKNVSPEDEPGNASVDKVKNVGRSPVLASNETRNGTVEALRAANFTVYQFREATSIEDIRSMTLRAGHLTNACDGANATVTEMNRTLATVEAAVEGQDRTRVLYYSSGQTAGEGTFVDLMIERAGGVNVAAQANVTGYGEIDSQTVVEKDPQWILLQAGNSEYPREAYNNTTAVNKSNSYLLNNTYFDQPSPRIVDAIVTLTKTFHPEAYANATTGTTGNTTPTPSNETTATPPSNATATPGSNGTTTPNRNGTGTPETANATVGNSSTPSPTPTYVPGFGVVSALLALLFGGALLRRR
jgi:iron complex transport system substrate-binding protein